MKNHLLLFLIPFLFWGCKQIEPKTEAELEEEAFYNQLSDQGKVVYDLNKQFPNTEYHLSLGYQLERVQEMLTLNNPRFLKGSVIHIQIEDSLQKELFATNLKTAPGTYDRDLQKVAELTGIDPTCFDSLLMWDDQIEKLFSKANSEPSSIESMGDSIEVDRMLHSPEGPSDGIFYLNESKQIIAFQSKFNDVFLRSSYNYNQCNLQSISTRFVRGEDQGLMEKTFLNGRIISDIANPENSKQSLIKPYTKTYTYNENGNITSVVYQSDRSADATSFEYSKNRIRVKRSFDQLGKTMVYYFNFSNP